MKIEGDKLFIDEALTDENVEEFLLALSQDDIKKVIIKNDDLSSGIIQAIWCSGKEVEVSGFLSKFFENVEVVD
jgi:ABC-type xylose transport system substrate-binding protein